MKAVTGRSFTTGPKVVPKPRFPLDELRATWWLAPKPTALVYDRERHLLGALMFELELESDRWHLGDRVRLAVPDRPPRVVVTSLLPALEDCFTFHHVELEIGPMFALGEERRMVLTYRSGDLDALDLCVFWPLEGPTLPRPEILAAMHREQERRGQIALIRCYQQIAEELRLRSSPPN